MSAPIDLGKLGDLATVVTVPGTSQQLLVPKTPKHEEFKLPVFFNLGSAFKHGIVLQQKRRGENEDMFEEITPSRGTEPFPDADSYLYVSLNGTRYNEAVANDGYSSFTIIRQGDICEQIFIISPVDIKGSMAVRLCVDDDILQLPDVSDLQAFIRHPVRMPRLLLTPIGMSTVKIEFKTKTKMGCDVIYGFLMDTVQRSEWSNKTFEYEALPGVLFKYHRGNLILSNTATAMISNATLPTSSPSSSLVRSRYRYYPLTSVCPLPPQTNYPSLLPPPEMAMTAMIEGPMVKGLYFVSKDSHTLEKIMITSQHDWDDELIIEITANGLILFELRVTPSKGLTVVDTPRLFYGYAIFVDVGIECRLSRTQKFDGNMILVMGRYDNPVWVDRTIIDVDDNNRANHMDGKPHVWTFEDTPLGLVYHDRVVGKISSR